MRASVGVVLAAALAVACLVGAGSSASIPTVGCSSIIDPDFDSARDWRATRVVLGVVDVPSAFISQAATESGVARWPYWMKSGIVVRANSPVVHVSVPARWKRRAVIGWGGVQGVSSLRIASCPASSTLPGGWNPYAGGFYLRSRTACVPLTFRVGERGATVRFGIGKRCG